MKKPPTNFGGFYQVGELGRILFRSQLWGDGLRFVEQILTMDTHRTGAHAESFPNLPVVQPLIHRSIDLAFFTSCKVKSKADCYPFLQIFLGSQEEVEGIRSID